MTPVQYLLTATVALMLAGGQFLFKLAAERWNEQAALGIGVQGLLSIPFFAALALYGVATILWIYALRVVPLSCAYLIVLAGAALVPIMAHYAFDEPLSSRFAIGMTLILVGLFLTNQ